MLIIFIRAILLYLLVLVVMRLMGKREIGQLQPFELAITILIADLVAIPMQDTGIPLIAGIIPVLTLLIAHLTLSYINLKSDRLRGVICGKPTILVENGKIVEQNLRDSRYNLNELMEQLRIRNFSNIADVEFAILETNGQVSVIPKSQKRPITPQDLQLNTNYEGLTWDLIVDGKVMGENLEKIGLDEKWLFNKLKTYNLTIDETFYASLDTKGELYFQKKD